MKIEILIAGGKQGVRAMSVQLSPQDTVVLLSPNEQIKVEQRVEPIKCLTVEHVFSSHPSAEERDETAGKLRRRIDPELQIDLRRLTPFGSLGCNELRIAAGELITNGSRYVERGMDDREFIEVEVAFYDCLVVLKVTNTTNMAYWKDVGQSLPVGDDGVPGHGYGCYFVRAINWRTFLGEPQWCLLPGMRLEARINAFYHPTP